MTQNLQQQIKPTLDKENENESKGFLSRLYIDLACNKFPSITEIIREIFHHLRRKEMQTEWQNTPKDGDHFVNSIGREAWVTATRRQKRLIESGNVDLWDLKLLTHVITKTKLGTPLKVKNTLRKLVELRCITSWEYAITDKSALQYYTRRLDSLCTKIIDYSITEVVPDRKIYSRKDKETVEKLKIAGNKHAKRENFVDAIKSYSRALEFKLPKEELAKLYSNRSAVYLQARDEDLESLHLEGNTRLKLSIDDAKSAVVLHPNWFRGHHRLGCAYFALRKLENAFKHFNIALQLDPEYCKAHKTPVEGLKRVIKSHVNKKNSQRYEKNLRELEKVLVKKYGNEFKSQLVDNFDPYSVSYLGQLHLEGKNGYAKDYLWWLQTGEYLATVVADFANPYYVQALNEGKKMKEWSDLRIWFSSLKDVAKRPLLYNDEINVGVREAEYEVGICYEKGLGTVPDIALAVHWFEKSAENGNDDAAIRLGVCHAIGRGVKKSIKKAEYFFTMAAERNCSEAMWKIPVYCVPRRIKEDCGVKQEGKVEEASLLDCMKDWEEKNGVCENDLSLLQRGFRFLEHTKRNESEFDNFFNCLCCKITPTGFSRDCQVWIDFDQHRSCIRSETTDGFLNAENHFRTAEDLLTNLTYDNVVTMIHEFAQCVRILGPTVRTVLNWHASVHRIMVIVVGMIEFTNDDESQFDLDLRVCYSLVLKNGLEATTEFCEKSMEKYLEKEPWFARHLCHLLTFSFSHEKGVEVAKQALRKYPKDVELRYYFAEHLLSCDKKNFQQIIAAFEMFFHVAPFDHRALASSYFKLAFYLYHFNTNHVTIRKYYDYGCLLESKRLPIYVTTEEYYKDILITEMASLTMRLDNKLNNPARISLIRDHRARVANNRFQNSVINDQIGDVYEPPLDFLMWITLKEMTENTYVEYKLRCHVIEDPLHKEWFAETVVEDENGDTARLRIVGRLSSEVVQQKMRNGCELTIAYPNIENGTGGKLMFVEEKEFLVVTGEADLSRCRFCGKTGAKSRCVLCKKVYCDRFCQLNDWRILKHEDVCVNVF